MLKDEDKLTKKEQEIMEALNQHGQVMVDDLKSLKQLAKKLEKIFGKSELI